MRLKKSYSAREVAAETGLSARQLQWWDARRVFRPAVAPRRTAAGGYTERRYSPVDLLELLVLADLRRRGFSVHKIRQLLDTLRDRFGVRLIEAIGDDGPITLLTDGREVYARTKQGEFFNLLRAPGQPLLVIGREGGLRQLTSRARGKKAQRKSSRSSRARRAST